ncbi:MAG: hypothetical protein Q4E59_04780 [Bacteroidales bacterium]|nr:hypothetical protein [Bacteroidales bacterium]
MEYCTPFTPSPREETLRFLQNFARSYVPGVAIPVKLNPDKWTKSPNAVTN